MLKAFLGVFIIVLYANINPVIGVRSDLTPEELDNLMKTWDQDRMEVGHQLKIPFQNVEYDLHLEITATNMVPCQLGFDKQDHIVIPLRWNNIMDDLMKRITEDLSEDNEITAVKIKNVLDAFFFNPNTRKIGCSKTNKCSNQIPDNFKYPELAGKTIETRGMCVLDTKFNDFEQFHKLLEVELPSISKYADIIGVKAL